jgi:hypothetical protein
MLPFLAALPAIASAAGGAAQAIGGAVGGANAAAEREAQKRMIEKFLRDNPVPNLPEVLAEQLGPSAMEGVGAQMDPRLRQAEYGTLDTLDQYAKEGGNAETRAAMNRVLADVARQEGAGRNAIWGKMRERGNTGSGAELAMQLDAHNTQADRAQTAGLEQGAAQQRRMLDAVMKRGQMAGDMRGRDYREATDAARAKDMISQYNAQGREKAKYYNAGLPAQQYGMTMQRGNLINGQAAMHGQAADRAAAQGAGVGQAFGQAASGVGDYFSGQQKRKDDQDFYLKLFGKDGK